MINKFEKEFPIFSHRLENGLKICVAPNKKASIFSVNLTYKTGSKNEVQGKSGISHLLEHLMFEGSVNLPKGEFDKSCSLAGGINNAFTTYDYTSYTMTLPSNQLELAFWLEAERMSEYAAGEEAFQAQKKVVIEEIMQTVFEQPYGRWRGALLSTAFSPESTYSWDIEGKIEDLESMTNGDVKEYFNKYYYPENACFVVSGDADPDEVVNYAEKYFNKLKGNDIQSNQFIFDSNHIKKGKTTVIEDNVPFDAAFVSFHCPGFLNPDVLKADLIAQIAGIGKSSRLYSSLISDKQTAAQTGAFVDKREFSSMISFFALSRDNNTNADMLADQILVVIADLMKKEISLREYRKTINQLSSHIAYEMQFQSAIADNLAEQLTFWNDPARIYSMLGKYQKITLEEVRNYARTILKPEEAIIVKVKAMN